MQGMHFMLPKLKYPGEAAALRVANPSLSDGRRPKELRGVRRQPRHRRPWRAATWTGCPWTGWRMGVTWTGRSRDCLPGLLARTCCPAGRSRPSRRQALPQAVAIRGALQARRLRPRGHLPRWLLEPACKQAWLRCREIWRGARICSNYPAHCGERPYRPSPCGTERSWPI